ncbi:3-deoxy-7-phosphoheptulonate synthase [Ceratobasidium theobromae]|uniref:3-deoxy-7-phosphoheptulonate synthase n=1 Tax=Ceratobasidium theobromae TaxID=1582974 RepID=A0A5N5QIP5_9AGAM|nr:3-deoxy-7-phosphoheptulonate synthase [Ceratobasidium theobromae]
MSKPAVSVHEAVAQLHNRRVKNIRPLIPPQILTEELPLSLIEANTVINGRLATEAILRGDDDRILVVVGPCSVHDPQAALEYAEKLKAYRENAKDDLEILMRAENYGWMEGSNQWADPYMNGTFQINKGLRTARKLLLDLSRIGLPTACEFLDTITPQYLADLTTWGAIGARTTESQVHRELTSALITDGSFDIAVDACRAARSGHCFLSVGKEGLSSIVETEGNPDTHIILRGGSTGPNYAAEHVRSAAGKLAKAGLPQKIMVDCSHGNSSKQHQRQVEVANDIATQLESSDTAPYIMGVMIESNLVEGRQNIPSVGPAGLKYGQSVTDACISWETTVPVLDRLREGVRARRANLQRQTGRTTPRMSGTETPGQQHDAANAPSVAGCQTGANNTSRALDNLDGPRTYGHDAVILERASAPNMLPLLMSRMDGVQYIDSAANLVALLSLCMWESY